MSVDHAKRLLREALISESEKEFCSLYKAENKGKGPSTKARLAHIKSLEKGGIIDSQLDELMQLIGSGKGNVVAVPIARFVFTSVIIPAIGATAAYLPEDVDYRVFLLLGTAGIGAIVAAVLTIPELYHAWQERTRK